MSASWQSAPYGGRITPSHPGAGPLTVEVLLSSKSTQGRPTA